eukprot:TRINITY_DN27859_c0_g1_i1.p1 TRINITY_DN27859_c0_g1~~TRINITY_DN27859_c0_g1_i1.p1  ORF type:complete len:602 (-),score=83.74 TRINITY_DN27859_c0_g1_i1:23-1828(-)
MRRASFLGSGAPTCKENSQFDLLCVLKVAHSHLREAGPLRYAAAVLSLGGYSAGIILRGVLVQHFLRTIQGDPTAPLPFSWGPPLFLLVFCWDSLMLYGCCRFICRCIAASEARVRRVAFAVSTTMDDSPAFSRAELSSVFASDVLVERRLFIGLFWGLLFGAFQVTAALIFLFVLDPATAACAVCVFFGMLVCSPTRQAAMQSCRAREELSRITANYDNMLQCLPMVRAYCIQEMLQTRFNTDLDRYQETLYHAEVTASTVQVALTVGINLYLTVAILVLGYSVHSGRMSVGAFVAFVHTITSVLAPARGLADFFRQSFTMGSSVARVEQLIGSKLLRVNIKPQLPKGLVKLQREIVLEGVGFSYDCTSVLRGVTASFVHPSLNCVIGRSGCGKSTLLRLLLGALKPQEGRILFDGQDLNPTAESWPRPGVVFQETHLLNGSVLENIRCGYPEASEEECRRAAMLAGIHDTIAQLPKGYSTRLGTVDPDTALSGGQAQRLALARALVRRPQLLLLDEATEALDPITEEAIMSDIARIVRDGDTTVVAVTHRLHTTRDADQILVLDNGVVHERGTFSQLMQRDGLFADLVAHCGTTVRNAE